MIQRSLYQYAVKAPGFYCYTHMRYKIEYSLLYLPQFNQWMIYIFNN